ncbi:hypothetical protein TgHK011_009676 [Trichoderma gracile]|nr:hypothetical protein TgHK011_009676 [Trichoderma gracile]
MSGPDRDQPVAETSASPAGYYHQHHHGGSSSSLAASSSSPVQRRSSQTYRRNLHPDQLQSQNQGQGQGSSQPHRQQQQQQQQQFVVAASEGAAMGARPGEAQSSLDQQHQGHEPHSDIVNTETDDNPNNDHPPTTTAAAAAAAADHESDSASFPPFEPIFTLLTNTTTNTTVHPRVHYLFSDDDASAIFTAPQTDPLHRALVVDLAPPSEPNGKWSVSWASSLTPDFAVTSSQLSLQQHGSGAAGAAGADNGNENAATTSVMLRVEGVEREPVGSRPNSLPASGSGIVGRENVEQLVEEFRRRMGVLKKVVEEGERRKEAMARMNEGVHSEEGGDASGAPPRESTGPLVLEDDGTG